MIIQILIRHGEYFDINIMEKPKFIPIDVEVIQIDSEEVPILDGSSKEFIECLESCDFMDQDAARNYIEISEKILYKDDENNVEIAAYPHSNYRITCMVDYNSEVLGSQHHTLNKISKFKKVN